MTSLLATVIVVNWNGAHLLPACLDGLRRQNGAVSFETWVVDNASHDESVQLMRERYPEVRIVQSDRNRGFAGGNNLALEMVTSPFAVLLNNDAVPEPDWLECLLAPMREPGSESIGATTGKVVFASRYARMRLSTPGFVAGPEDSRELGVRIGSVDVGTAGDADRPVGRVLNDVLWERLIYGREGPPDAPFFWTRPAGEFLVPVPEGEVDLTFGWAAERPKEVDLSWEGGGSVIVPVNADPSQATVHLPATTPRFDVINNVGGIVITEGYGADRGYQQVDEGQFDAPEEVFTACGNGVAMRTELGHRLGWFDADFFLYYEDTDLSWRLRALGYEIRYEPARSAAPFTRRQQQGMVAAVRLPRRPQPAADADEECDRFPGCEGGGPLPADHRVDVRPVASAGCPDSAPATDPADVAAAARDRKLCASASPHVAPAARDVERSRRQAGIAEAMAAHAGAVGHARAPARYR